MARYTEVEVGQRVKFGSELLLIHARDAFDNHRPLVVMIHGLQGDGFATWRPILQSEWLRGAHDFDVGLVNYASGLKRLGKLVQLSPEDVAGDLAREISQLSPRKIVLVGHSMGGLIAKRTVQQLHQRYGQASPHTKSVAGVVAMCTPSTGSGWAQLLSVLPGPAWRDRQVLRRHSRLQHEVEEFFSTWVEVEAGAWATTKLHVPTFGASASRDMFVNRMGAELGLPATQRMTLAGGHSTSLRSVGAVQWLATTISAILEPRVRTQSAQHVVRAEFNGSGAFPAWEGAYRLALAQFIEEYGDGSIVDVPLVCGQEPPDLIVRAFSAHSSSPALPAEIQEDVARQQKSAGTVALGISPIGSNAAAAVRQLEAQLNAPRLRWFRGVRDNDAEIVAAFREFFTLTTGAVQTRIKPIGQQLIDRREG